MLVSILSTPASADVLSTTSQFTWSSSALVPMAATAVYATVFTARTPAAFSHFFQFAIPRSFPHHHRPHLDISRRCRIPGDMHAFL